MSGAPRERVYANRVDLWALWVFGNDRSCLLCKSTHHGQIWIVSTTHENVTWNRARPPAAASPLCTSAQPPPGTWLPVSRGAGHGSSSLAAVGRAGITLAVRGRGSCVLVHTLAPSYYSWRRLLPGPEAVDVVADKEPLDDACPSPPLLRASHHRVPHGTIPLPHTPPTPDPPLAPPRGRDIPQATQLSWTPICATCQAGEALSVDSEREQHHGCPQAADGGRQQGCLT
jgi:hypothetical protein